MNGGVETALVIGATSDIGRAIAHTLAEEGCACSSRPETSARLERTRDLRVRTGVAVTAHRCDVLEEDGAAAERVMRTNYVGPALLMGALAERFERRGGGVLVGVSSVAGERGRASNYVYGSAKAGFTAFLSGLRSRPAAFTVLRWCAPNRSEPVRVSRGFVRAPRRAGRRPRPCCKGGG